MSSNHAKAALLAVGGRLFQSFKGANPWVIDFGLPVESGLSLFPVAQSEPLLRSEISHLFLVIIWAMDFGLTSEPIFALPMSRDEERHDTGRPVQLPLPIAI